MKGVYSSSRRRRAPAKAVEAPLAPTIWDKPLWEDRQCARPAIPDAKNPLFHTACLETFPHNANQTYCSKECRLEVAKKYDRDSYRTETPVKIKQCAVPGCGNTFPDRMGGPLYCPDCRKRVTQAIKRKSVLKNRERNRPKRAAQARVRRAAWPKEKHERVKAEMREQYHAKKSPPPEVQCDCGKMFLKIGNRKYCGDDCPVKLERRRGGKRAYNDKYYAANREKEIARSRAFYRANVEANRDMVNARARKYLAANRETINTQRRERRAKKAAEGLQAEA